MASLSHEKRKKIKKRKRRFSIFLFIISLFTLPYGAAYIDALFINRFNFDKVKIDYLESFISYFRNEKQLYLFILFEVVVLLLIILIHTNYKGNIGRSDTMMVTNKIEIPVACGEGQHGTSRFLSEEEKKDVFQLIEYNPSKEIKIHENIGVVLGMTKKGKKEIITCIKDDYHTLLIGSTRSGKSRGTILQSIWLLALAGHSMIISDPKGELFLYCSHYLKEQGYEVIDLDFRQPLKSKHYNFLTDIVRAVKEKNIPKAIDKTWDLVSVLVGVPKGEPLWTDGQSAVIASSILVVALEAPDEFKDLTNVYYFLANMCKVNEYGEMPITSYFKELPDTHPAKGIFAVAEISPDRTRGSFFGSALATLRLFTNWNIADMTSKTDFDIEDIANEKTALFIIIPDEKSTMYSLVSLFINQLYVNLVEAANKNGGRLPLVVDFVLDEFGNFPAIPSFGSMLSVGAGRGLHFNLVIQDFQQLEKNYKEDSENIKGNCQLWIYLRTTSQKTLEEISKKTGTYTVQVNSVNSSVSGHKNTLSNTSYSDSANMQSRALLLPAEVGRIDRPYSLVLNAGEHPSIFYAPDISKYYANQELGLGDKQHNQKLIIERDNIREERKSRELKLWGIWNQLNDLNDNNQEEKSERISFLDID